MIVNEVVYSTLANRCPRCHKGKIFVGDNPYNLLKFSKMECSCSNCGLHYEKEPGFFYGAMYVSYALMAGVFIIWFLTDLLWIHMDAMALALSVVSTIVVLAPAAYRWSKVIWLNFFIRYDKKLKEMKIETCQLNN